MEGSVRHSYCYCFHSSFCKAPPQLVSWMTANEAEHLPSSALIMVTQLKASNGAQGSTPHNWEELRGTRGQRNLPGSQRNSSNEIQEGPRLGTCFSPPFTVCTAVESTGPGHRDKRHYAGVRTGQAAQAYETRVTLLHLVRNSCGRIRGSLLACHHLRFCLAVSNLGGLFTKYCLFPHTAEWRVCPCPKA